MIAQWIDHGVSSAHHRNRHRPCVECAAVGATVDARRQSTDDRTTRDPTAEVPRATRRVRTSAGPTENTELFEMQVLGKFADVDRGPFIGATRIERAVAVARTIKRDQSDAFAGALMKLPEGERLDRVCRLCYGRAATEAEKGVAGKFVAGYGDARKAWAAWVRVTFASNDFLYVE